MAWLAVDSESTSKKFKRHSVEFIYSSKPFKKDGVWVGCDYLSIPNGSIEKLIGRKLTWEDEPVEI